MGGKHRRDKTPEVTRRSLLAMVVGGTAAAGVVVATSGKLYHADDLHRVLAETTAPTSVTQTATSTAAPTTEPPAPTTTTPSTTAQAKPATSQPSVSELLAEQPRSGWGLLPAAAASTHLIASVFGIAQVGGYRASSAIAGSDHPFRLAADFMTSNQKANRAIGNFAIANRKLLRVKYAISLQHYNDGSGWKLMENRGSATANHFDHCHVSFY